MKARYGFVPKNFRKKSYFTTVSKMLSTDLIRRKLNSKGLPYLELTSNGENEFKRRFPVFTKKGKKWDGYFMQVIFDIPEKERKVRQMLRLKLKELGFGMIQESVFISPFHFEDDLKEYLVQSELSDYVYILTVKGFLFGDIKLLAEKVWKIGDINDKYLSLYKTITKKSDKQNIKIYWKEYLRILVTDPFLPEEFLPKNWIREKVSKAILDLDREKIRTTDT